MKSNILNVSRLFVVACLLFLGAGIVAAQEKDGITTAPIVPIETVVRGRQAIADFLTINTDHATLGLSGTSVVAPDNRYFDMQALVNLGYVHRGSFKEFSDALANVPFNPDVIPTPEGWYDVRVEVTSYTQDGRTGLHGWGYLNINTLPDGSLVASKFEPYVSINNSIAIRFPKCISSAMWIPRDGFPPEWLPVYSDSEGCLTVVQDYMLENGILAIADYNGEVTGWDLNGGKTIEGKHVFALLGKIRSGAILPLKSPEKPVIDVADQVSFYKYNGLVYGRMPLVEQVFDSAVKDYFTLEVPVWNSTEKAHPTQAFVTPITIYGPANGLELYKEYEVGITDQGRIGLGLPAGTYHIRTVFKGIHDWSELGGMGKGLN